jgi:hypothetical protein
MNVGYYGGRSRNGEGHVIVIGGQSWTWKANKFLNNLLRYIPVGQGFTSEGGYDEEKEELFLEWGTLEWTEMVEDIPAKHILNNAAGEKARTIKTVQKKVDSDNFSDLTLKDIAEHMIGLNKSQKAALMARVMAEINY